MAIPSINDLIKYTTSKLTGANLNSNFTKIVNWFTNGQADVSFKTITTAGSVTVGGSVDIAGSLTIAGASILMPVGTILAYAAELAPIGYLVCDGSAVSRVTYANLFILIDESFGQGDNTTTFNLPDFRGRFLRGWDDGATHDPNSAGRTAMATGGNTGDNIGSIQTDSFQGHWHNYNYRTTGTTGTAEQIGNDGAGGSTAVATVRSAITDATYGTARVSTETRPINAYVNYIIKY